MESTHLRLRPVAPEVIYSDGGFLAVDGSMISMLKDRARETPRQRSRLCFHADPKSGQQEMLIVMRRASYVRPHRHIGKAETLTLVEGKCDAILFDPSGAVTNVIAMSPAAEGDSFFYRMPSQVFHTLVFRADWVVFLETTIGPFDRSMTEVAEWAPPETDAEAGLVYLSGLARPAR